jgi:molecular chaperone HscB
MNGQPNYFELFDIEVQYAVDVAMIRKKFLTLSRKFHPDFLAQATEAEQAEGLAMSSTINEAYKTLGNPMACIEYVLKLHNSIKQDEKPVLSNDFLMEMMELNEALTEAKMDADDKAIGAAMQSLQLIEANEFDKVEHILRSNLFDEASLTLVKDYFFKKKYINRILEQNN